MISEAGSVWRPSDGGSDDGADLRPLEADRLAFDDRAHRVALREASFEQLERERVLDEALDRALQRPGAEGWIPAGLGDQLDRARRTARA